MDIEDECSQFPDDSGFEILPYPYTEEEEYAGSSSMWSGTLNSSFYESMNDSFSSQKTTEETITNNQDVPLNFENSFLKLETESHEVLNSDFYHKQVGIDNALIQPAGDASSRDIKCENLSCTTNKNMVKIDSLSFEVIGENISRYQPTEMMENYLKINSLDDHRSESDDGIPVAELVKDSENQRTGSSSSLQEIERNVQQQTIKKISKNRMVQMHPERKNCSKEICFLLKQGVKLCSWFRNNKYLHNFVAGTKSSFFSFLNMFELEMNLLLGMEDPLRILIIANVPDSTAIEKAFYDTLRGQVLIATRQIEDDYTIVPVLPIGYNYALQVAQYKINKARQLSNSENIVMITTVRFIAEIIPHRWQTSTVLCLEDPNLQLNLHNFTSTIPVPNQYIYQAHELTPDDYPFREQGLAVTLEDTIGCTVSDESEDTQKFLSGVSYVVSLKSAADILAGMYRKYANRFP